MDWNGGMDYIWNDYGILRTADSIISHCVLAPLSLSTLSDLRRLSFISGKATSYMYRMCLKLIECALTFDPKHFKENA